ncbi:flagellar hook-associated protein FlgK [Tabrizicola oligotrophica]|uniref:Flagellar hook-associated protein 1 n=1 Tax=Tabrizicola oligotrophica TaxID=2710650 RepID=A0A6M0QVZ7_9RHOB|nr:flagellar hook-associated protein FlgK [Tabrizicola oligotrophica]NEY91161.1 flagellar hook-associated protein FlgK [Tabrizicola oligotrophica]
MSISGSLSSALSGLTAAAKAAEVVSSNIANATTAGYSRREVITTARAVGQTGQGVSIVGVRRHVDPVLLADRRRAEATEAERVARSSFFQRLEAAIGTADSAVSLGGRIAEFDTALLEAASLPDSEARLARVIDTARNLASQIGGAAEAVQTARAEADDRIEADVDLLNRTLAQISELNGNIRATYAGARDPSALIDQRQQLIDSIASVVPLREIARDDGQIALYTTGGAMLVDGQAAVFGFDPAGLVTAEMSIGAGSLSGLTLNGRPVATSGSDSPISGGSLAAHFEVRDQLAPEAQRELDALARDLLERFADPAVDATLAPGQAGLFTDDGGNFLPADEAGLAQRLALNAVVDPRQGGGLWHLRDGIGATTPGLAGNAAGLVALHAALTSARTPASGPFMAGARSFAALQGDLLSGCVSDRLTAETEAGYAAARAEALTQLELAAGVDTDQEMQSLLLVEQAYTANAKVIQTIGAMIDTLLGL